jgi:hypothetical protein
VKKIHETTQEGDVYLTQYEDGDAVLYNSESGDSLYLDAADLAKAGRLVIAAHVTAGRLKQARS